MSGYPMERRYWHYPPGRPDTIAPAEPGHQVEVGQHSLARG